MSFFWPTKLNPNATILVRTGRVLHWLGSAIALVVGIYAYLNIGDAFDLILNSKPTGGALRLGLGIVLLVTSPVIFLLGRGFRYIISRE